ncbi:MAG: sigma-70 family RNA polymerase sigma factor [Deltaproteobacteria bacterium]|nr:sigma-70 family RNA polymerase sigma factor [Deltaproteobacteria bacterium]
MADQTATGRPGAADPLVAAVLAGAPDARDRLFETYAPVVHAAISRYLALRCRGRIDLADDLTHEVFLALLHDDNRRLRHFEGRNGCSFAGWLRVVAVRLVIDVLRRDRRLVSLDDDGPAMTNLRRTLRSAGGDPELGLQGSEVAARLASAIASLGPKDRLLVELHLLRGASLPAVAAALGVTANAAYVRKSRILERLRRSVEETP